MGLVQSTPGEGAAPASIGTGYVPQLCFGASFVERACLDSDTELYLTCILADMRHCSGMSGCRHWPGSMQGITDFCVASQAHLARLLDEGTNFEREPIITTNQIGNLGALVNDVELALRLEGHPMPVYLCNHVRFLASQILRNLDVTQPAEAKPGPIAVAE